MRQTKILPSPSASASVPGSLQVAYPPLLEVGPSRRYLRESFTTCQAPYPGGFPWCSCPFLPMATSAFPQFQMVGFPTIIHTATSVWGMLSGSQAFLYVLARCFARHPGCSHSRLSSRAAMTSTSRHAPDGYPVQVPDMLAVRTGQLTAPGLSPS